MMPPVCPPAIVTPTIEVVRADPSVAMDTGLSIAALTHKAGHDGEHVEVRGLTVNNLQRQIRLHMEGRPLPENPDLACYRLTGIEVTILPITTVYVASEYPAGSCAYKAVLQHENRHVVSFLDALWRYRAQVRDTVWATVWRIGVQGPFDEADANQFMTTLRQALDAALLPYDENLLARDRGLQEKIDNSGEYANVARQIEKCLRRGR
ncbi:MAG TPA: hypothetical protein DCW68_00475 [Rhodospirillaceae bacterium]|nr:MAG: hypothetical protein A2018_01790 [Alphaproteobacteria bacterium GWF2_58_20]HAU28576.1 hypothetical protein [Rhodospirillaceae bacterium]